jgi:hypothetical protein
LFHYFFGGIFIDPNLSEKVVLSKNEGFQFILIWFPLFSFPPNLWIKLS